MDERVAQFRVGVMVLATIIIAAILILLFNRFPAIGAGSYTIYVRFPTAPGVAKDTPVRRSGILIGRVSDVDFDENYNVIVTLRIDGDQKIFADDEIRITRSLLGDSELEVLRPSSPAAEPRATAKPQLPSQVQPPSQQPAIPELDRSSKSGEQQGAAVSQAAHWTTEHSGRRRLYVLSVLERKRRSPYLLAVFPQTIAQAQPPIRDAQPAPLQAPAQPPSRAAEEVPVAPGTTLRGRVATTPLDSLEGLQGDFREAAQALSRAGNEVGTLSRNLNDLFSRNEQQIDRIIKQTDEALSSFQLAMRNANDILGDEEIRANLKQTLRDLPKLFQETQRAISSIEGAMRLVDSNLRNLEGFTEPLGQRGNAIVGNIDSSIARLNQLLGQVETFSRALNNPQGTLGRLINEREMYDELAQAAANVNQLTERLKPIVEDARIFADKIARHPGVILRDAAHPGSGTKWATDR
jgi:ABC-type transporter Mla subunit MlaD